MFRLATILGLVALPALAEPPLARLELNTLEQTNDSCRVTFTGKAQSALHHLVVETVLFDRSGGVFMLTLFDFGQLPARKFRVRQFDLPQTSCADISRILFNGVQTCSDPDASSAPCDGLLSVGSRLETVEVLG